MKDKTIEERIEGKELSDAVQTLYKDIAKASKRNKVNLGKTLRVFQDAYGTHKQQHGSFVFAKDYDEKMKQRYLFMHDCAINYINEALDDREEKLR